METPFQVGGTRFLPGIRFLQQSSCARSTACCMRPTKIRKKSPQLALRNCRITRRPDSPPWHSAKREGVPPCLHLPLLKAKRQNLTPNLLRRDLLFLTRCRASEGFLREKKKTNHVPLLGIGTYHAGVTFATGQSRTRMGLHANQPLTHWCDLRAPYVPAAAQPSPGCLGDAACSSAAL